MQKVDKMQMFHNKQITSMQNNTKNLKLPKSEGKILNKSDKKTHHNFNKGLATILGVPKAILLANISLWIDSNKRLKKKEYYKDGKWWTKQSSKDFTQTHTYLNDKSVSRWLNELESDGWLISGDYNEDRTDRSKWYAYGEKLTQWVISNKQRPYYSNEPIELIPSRIPKPEKIRKLSKRLLRAFLKMRNAKKTTEGISQNEEGISQNEESYIRNHVIDSCKEEEQEDSSSFLEKKLSEFEMRISIQSLQAEVEKLRKEKEGLQGRYYENYSNNFIHTNKIKIPENTEAEFETFMMAKGEELMKLLLKDENFCLKTDEKSFMLVACNLYKCAIRNNLSSNDLLEEYKAYILNRAETGSYGFQSVDKFLDSLLTKSYRKSKIKAYKSESNTHPRAVEATPEQIADIIRIREIKKAKLQSKGV